MKISKSRKNIIVFLIMGATYCLVEIIWRRYTHPSMFVVGGICGLLIGLIDEYTPQMNIVLQCLLGAVIVTYIELISGCILNLWLGLDIWDYSELPFNIMGQVSLLYTFYWSLLSFVIIKLDNCVRNSINKGSSSK